ncbi:MAG TPA: hypothetical protein VLL94_12980, partial [Nitrospiraceae bacterium]|nr:hypothetical protein [Nitrospiraceae bacterium]
MADPVFVDDRHFGERLTYLWHEKDRIIAKTLTANKISYHDAFPVGIEKDELERLLADFASSA